MHPFLFSTFALETLIYKFIDIQDGNSSSVAIMLGFIQAVLLMSVF